MAATCRNQESVNVTLEHLGPCKKLLRIDVEATQVKGAFDEVATYFVKNASIPGFRAGRAPRDMVLKRFEEDIRTEVKRKLYSDVFRQAVKDQKLDVIADPDVEEIQFAPTRMPRSPSRLRPPPSSSFPNTAA